MIINPLLKPLKIYQLSIIGVFVICLMVFGGWFFDIIYLRVGLPNSPQTTPFTALIILSYVITLFTLGKSTLRQLILFYFFLFLAITLSVFFGIQYLLNLDPSIEILLFEEEVLKINQMYPGRPSPHTLITSILFGVWVLLWNSTLRNSVVLSIIKVATWSIPWLALFGYASSFMVFFSLPEVPETGMSPLTAISFLLLTISILFYDVGSRFVRLLYSKSYGGTLIRTFLPAALLFPFIMTLIKNLLLENSLIDLDWGIASLFITFLGIAGCFSINDFERREHEALVNLKRSESHLKLVINNMNDGLSISRAIFKDDQFVDSEIIDMNPIMEKILGRSREELIGKKIKEVSTTSPETATVVFDRTVELLKSGTPQKFTVQVSKNLNWIEFSMYSITQNEYATIVRDISDQVRLSKELEEHNIQLSEKNKEIEHFAYIASHDLQEPLSTMNNMLTMLQEDKADEIKPLERYFYFFEQSIARMKALVAGLLDYSRLGQKKELLKINVHTLLNDIRSDLSARIESSNGTLNIDSMPTIWGYRVELRLLFQNLISNAFKFMKPNEIPEISITVEDRKLDWLFKVKDNGIGIKEQNLEKIFVIFQRLNAEDAYEGTGIGLAHCKKIVELHRGQIWVESKYGEGSTFNFTIHKNLKADHEKKT